MKHARTIINALGPDAMQSRLGVTAHSIRHHKTVGTMPANWYVVVSEMCLEAGIECPVEAFNFKATGATSGDCMGEVA